MNDPDLPRARRAGEALDGAGRGPGRVHTLTGHKVTANFKNGGKQVICNGAHLVLIADAPRGAQ